jgi:hypothetical protein
MMVIQMESEWTLRVGMGACVLVLSSMVPHQGVAQSSSCHLLAQGGGLFAGSCDFANSTRRIELSRPEAANDALWAGVMELGRGPGPLPIEISTYQYSSGPALIIRTGAWHTLSEFAVSDEGLRVAWDEGAEAPPSQIDLDIFLAARELLRDEALWDREDDRDCENDGSRISLYCALARSTAAKMGRYQHRQPAMQAVRRVIAAEWPERVVDHRLMNFNNDPRTTLDDVRRLFTLAEESLRSTLR